MEILPEDFLKSFRDFKKNRKNRTLILTLFILHIFFRSVMRSFVRGESGYGPSCAHYDFVFKMRNLEGSERHLCELTALALSCVCSTVAQSSRLSTSSPSPVLT
jgi:hypothetical protein